MRRVAPVRVLQVFALIGFLTVWASAGRTVAQAQVTDASVSELTTSLVNAVTATDYARIGSLLSPDAVVTFQNGDSVRGRDEIQKYVKDLFVGKAALVQAYSGTPTVESTVSLDALTAVVTGTSADRLTLSSGAPMDLTTHWTATIVQRDGQWKIAALHLSTSILDNPFIEKMKMTSYLLCAFGLVMGLTIGAGLMMLFRRRSAKQQPVA